jgi:predicted dienelactone hydrolase
MTYRFLHRAAMLAAALSFCAVGLANAEPATDEKTPQPRGNRLNQLDPAQREELLRRFRERGGQGKMDPDRLKEARERMRQQEKRAADATHTGTGPHQVREIEFPIPAQRWQKEMAVRVYFPESGGPYPLIVFCAGSGGGNDTFADTSIFLASHGYVVLHTSYPSESRRGAKGNEGLTTQRVADISLALDSLDKMTALQPKLKGKFDAARVGAMGHSSGAYITQLVGGATVVWDGTTRSFRDRRVKAIIQYSGQGSDQQGLTKDSWKNLTIPMLTFTGTKDRGATGGGPEWKKEPFDLSPAGDKYHVCYEGGHHGSFSGKFARDASSKTIYAHCQTLTLAFWNACLKDDAKAKAWLQSDAVREGSNGLAEVSRR